MSPQLAHKLAAVQRKHASVSIASAVAGAVGLLAVAVGIQMLLDWWFELSTLTRAALLAIDLAMVAGIIVRYAVMPVMHGPDAEEAALWVERDEPSFKSRLISSVQFGRGDLAVAGASKAMVGALLQQTEELAETIDFTRVVRTDLMMKIGGGSALAVLVVGIICLWAGSSAGALLERVLLVPGVEVPRKTRVECLTKNITVGLGDPVTLTARAEGVIPAGGSLWLDFSSGAHSSFPMEKTPADASLFSRAIDSVQEPFDYTVYLNDGHSQRFHVDAVPRPAVMGMECTETYPGYTKLSPEKKSPSDLTILAGSRLGIAITANKPVKPTADLKGNHIHFYGSEIDYPLFCDPTNAAHLIARDGGDANLPVPAGTTGFSVELIDTFGLRSKDSAIFRIDQVPDHPPTVKITYPEGKDVTSTVRAKVLLGIEATDDFAIGKVAIHYRVSKVGVDQAAEKDPNGLNAEYFNLEDPGEPGKGIRRIDPNLDFAWDAGASPAPEIRPENFSARWQGSIRVPYSEAYTFHGDFDDAVRLWIDGKVVLERWSGNGMNADSPPVFLEAGRLHSLKVEFRQRQGAAVAKLSWRSRRQPLEAVPHTALFRWYNDPAAPNPDASALGRPNIPADAVGLVAYWPFDKDAEGTVNDAAGLANGTVINAKHVPGKINSAISFEGPDQRVEIPASPAMNFVAGDSFSLSAWVNARQVGDKEQSIITKSRDTHAWYAMTIDNTHHFAFASQRPDKGGDIQGALVTDGWHHVVLVQDGTAKTRTIYVDGVQGQSAPAQEANGPGDLVLGGSKAKQPTPFNGMLDDVRLYARALSEAEVARMAATPRDVHVPTVAEMFASTTVADDSKSIDLDLAGETPKSLRRRFSWDVAAIKPELTPGDTVEFWVDATDTNDATGPGVGHSDHCTLHVLTDAEKRQELMGRWGEALGQINDVSQNQRDVASKLGTVILQKQ